ncbi:MAG TPA: hypothetical protein DEH78_03455 [Solibacterales bacterium]|nr:hypothetical protein [Bryobacterales bacterium]
MGPRERETQEIAATGHLAVRNLRVTQGYYELATAFARGLEGHANWCAFAAWASRQAGRTIRGEDLAEQIDAGLAAAGSPLWRALLRRGLFQPETALGSFVRRVHTPFDAFERLSEAVSRGNIKVFAEIAPVFARYLDSGMARVAPATPEFAAFLQTLTPGDPPDGQELLGQAFTNYQHARFTSDPKTRAEMVLLANAQVGLHEQTRLQPEIEDSLNAPAAVAGELAGRWWRRLALPGFESFALRFSRAVITGRLMTLALPWRTVHLGRDLDEPVPAALEALQHPGLRELGARFALDRPSGAGDWSNFDQRMRFILRLFLVCQTRPELFNAPFSPAQLASIEAGAIPSGVL